MFGILTHNCFEWCQWFNLIFLCVLVWDFSILLKSLFFPHWVLLASLPNISCPYMYFILVILLMYYIYSYKVTYLESIYNKLFFFHHFFLLTISLCLLFFKCVPYNKNVFRSLSAWLTDLNLNRERSAVCSFACLSLYSLQHLCCLNFLYIAKHKEKKNTTFSV